MAEYEMTKDDERAARPGSVPEGEALVAKELRNPRQFRVLLHNDNYTTMDFVVYILQTVFHKAPAEATAIMLAVHRRGIGECGVYTREVAETKVRIVHGKAREAGYPLLCSMEEIQ